MLYSTTDVVKLDQYDHVYKYKLANPIALYNEVEDEQLPEVQLSETLTYYSPVYNFTNNERNDRSTTLKLNKFISKYMRRVDKVNNPIMIDGLYVWSNTPLDATTFTLVSQLSNFNPLTVQELVEMKEILVRTDPEPIVETTITLLEPEHIGLTRDELTVNHNKYFIDGETIERTDEKGDTTVNVWSYMYINGDFTEQEYHDGDVSGMISMIKQVVTRNPDAEFYFHNLKFDASYLVVGLTKAGYKPNYNKKPFNLTQGEFQVFASSAGWYTLTVNFGTEEPTVMRDSLKIMTMSVSTLGKTIGAPQGKSIIDYNRPRPEGYVSTPAERDYGMQDVRIPALAYYVLVTEQELQGNTAAGSAIAEVKEMDADFDGHFINQLSDDEEHELQKSYRGGYVYVNPNHKNQTLNSVHVYDANSAYPDKMQNSKLPYGSLTHHKGYAPTDGTHYAWYKVILKGKLQRGMLPTLQMKTTDAGFMSDNPDFIEKHPGHNSRDYATEFKNDVLWLTETDLELVKLNFGPGVVKKVIETYMSEAKKGLFAEFVSKHMARKIQASKEGNAGARFSAKLFLNSSYGKFGVKGDSEHLEIFAFNDTITTKHIASTQDTYHVGVASAITAYVRDATVRFALALGDDYLYSDTDSCHSIATLDPKRAKKFGVRLDENELGAWKDETEDPKKGKAIVKGKVLGPKLYRYEYETGKCKTAGAGITGDMWAQITHDNFNYGLVIPGKLESKQIKGGMALQETTFTIAEVTAQTPKSKLAKQL